MRPMLSVLLVLLALSWPAAPTKVTTIFVVRHAEKAVVADDPDPGLAPAGSTRAEDLARALRSVGVSACFASQYQRTRSTLAPLAAALGLEVTVYQAGKEKDLAARLRADYAGKTVAVAGHSNTVPGLLRALGVTDVPTLGEQDYDDLFVVEIAGEGPPRLLHLHYGAANPR
ncbi:MAG: histidine phosphatase family protein [Planctomycetes bacterium]|nr:histidine phosphatase family protein [Planctomycetota bacterium]